MARRVRPKTRPTTSSHGEESQVKRIKIRMRRDSSDTIESLIVQAKKEAAKDANFKGFKAGVKSGTNKQKKKTEKVEGELEKEQDKYRLVEGRLYVVERALSAAIEEKPDVLVLLGAKGLRMQNAGRDFTERWIFTWDGDNAVVRDSDGVDRVASTMQRHRLHPGRRIPIREMWPIWNAVPVTERPDIDPLQGIRGAWYWDARRYSTHSSAMNAWRRHMHNKQTEQAEREALDSIMPERDEPEEDVYAADEDEFGTPYATGTDPAAISRQRNNMRNRINRLLRNHGLNPVSYWTRHYTDRQDVIDNEPHADLNSFSRVCASFGEPLEEWDDLSWSEFRSDINYYLEVVQNRGEAAAGTPSTRRRSGRRAVRGYNRNNY